MSSPVKEDVPDSDDSQKPEPEAEDDLKMTEENMDDDDAFADIDKRLGILLERATKLEITLNQINGQCKLQTENLKKKHERQKKLDLLKDVGAADRFEDDIDLNESDNLDIDSSDVNAFTDGLPEELQKVYLDIQED